MWRSVAIQQDLSGASEVRSVVVFLVASISANARAARRHHQQKFSERPGGLEARKCFGFGTVCFTDAECRDRGWAGCIRGALPKRGTGATELRELDGCRA
jgi:hypothetical protein